MSARTDKAEAMHQLEGPRALRLEEHPSAIKLLNSTLRPDGPPMILNEYPLVLGKGNSENMRVVVRGKEVISHAAIWFSKLRARGAIFDVGGIGSVATHSAYQGQGLASAVMRDCIEIMRMSRCHLSVLWTQEHDFYRKLGY
jgi:GNAT superfamily N-acetyltransferase